MARHAASVVGSRDPAAYLCRPAQWASPTPPGLN